MIGGFPDSPRNPRIPRMKLHSRCPTNMLLPSHNSCTISLEPHQNVMFRITPQRSGHISRAVTTTSRKQTGAAGASRRFCLRLASDVVIGVEQERDELDDMRFPRFPNSVNAPGMALLSVENSLMFFRHRRIRFSSSCQACEDTDKSREARDGVVFFFLTSTHRNRLLLEH